MKKLLIGSAVIAVLVITYMLGPAPKPPVYSQVFPEAPASLSQVEQYLAQRENDPNIRADNDAKIIWAHDTPSVTEYAILYLHGFSASRVEGSPVHTEIAQLFGCNLYLSRLADHGLKENQLEGFTAERIWESAKDALAIAQLLGKKLIIISTSTGSTLALKLAADYPEKITALINFSPNIEIRNPAAAILNDPWGLQIARLVYGGDKRRIRHKQEEAPLYWDTLYPAEATVQLEVLLETTMVDSVFEQVKCPVLNLYYYKDVDHQDEVVDVSVIPEMHEALGTPDSQKEIVALPTPGDHVIGSYVKSKDYQSVKEEVIRFCEKVLGMKPQDRRQL